MEKVKIVKRRKPIKVMRIGQNRKTKPVKQKEKGGVEVKVRKKL